VARLKLTSYKAPVSIICLILSLPWWVVEIIPKWAELFIVSYGLASTSSAVFSYRSIDLCATIGFFISGTWATITVEFAAVTKDIEGIGCKHFIHITVLGYLKFFYPQMPTFTAHSISRMA
jgi:hypothetical protein